jgi:hypothetical protein
VKGVKNRDSMLIDKPLYDFLHVHFGFIAHYDIHGFRSAYIKRSGMIDLLEELLHHHFEWGCASYNDIGNAMKAIARESLPVIRLEAEAEKKQQELVTQQRIASKHGYGIVPDGTSSLQIEQPSFASAPAYEQPSKKGGKRKREDHCEGQLLLLV